MPRSSQRQKKSESVHVRLTPGMKEKIHARTSITRVSQADEALLLIADGLTARECLSTSFLEDKRKKWM